MGRSFRIVWGQGWLSLILLLAPGCRSNLQADAALDAAGGHDAADASIDQFPSCVCGAVSLAAISLGECTFQVPCTPTDFADFAGFSITVNGEAVRRDEFHANGWDYYPETAMTSFRLFGPACDSATNGASVTIDPLCNVPR